MNYEDLRSTKLLATRCICCGRPLRDAKSVEMGIGPICREKYGYNDDIPEEARKKANQLVWHAALEDVSAEDKLHDADRIEGLGLVNLANKIRERFVTNAITIVAETNTFGRGDYARECDSLLVKTPWTGKADAAAFKTELKAAFNWRDLQAVFGEDKKFRGWAVKGREAKKLLWAVLLKTNDGDSGFGPKGYFKVQRASVAA